MRRWVMNKWFFVFCGCTFLAFSFLALSGGNENKWLVYSSKDLNAFEQKDKNYPEIAQKYFVLRSSLQKNYDKNREQDSYWDRYFKMLDLQYAHNIIFNLNSEELHREYDKLKWYLKNENGKKREFSRDMKLFMAEYSALRNTIWEREVCPFLRPATKEDYVKWISTQTAGGKTLVYSDFEIDLKKIYVATQNFKTIGKEAIIIVPKDVKWLGGELEGIPSLEKIVLCYQDKRDENKEVIVFANISYDLF